MALLFLTLQLCRYDQLVVGPTNPHACGSFPNRMHSLPKIIKSIFGTSPIQNQQSFEYVCMHGSSPSLMRLMPNLTRFVSKSHTFT